MLHNRSPSCPLPKRGVTWWQYLLAGLILLVMVKALGLSAADLRLERTATSLTLVAPPITAPGTFFIHQTSTVLALGTNPAVVFQANTPLADGLRFPIVPTSHAFFFSTFWPNRRVEEFGDPEYTGVVSPPGMVLMASGLPAVLTTGQVFTVEFFVTDPAGHLLSNLVGAVEIIAVRRTDGGLHPDAWVMPSRHTLAGGHLRAEIALGSISPLGGYTLSLNAVSDDSAALSSFPATLNLGPNPLPTFSPEGLLQRLANLRYANVDPDTSWGCPLWPAGNYAVAGTYGEWRGRENQHVHLGLDLAAGDTAVVVASRGGVIACETTLPGLGACVVVDHGDGWFSGYFHLGADSIVVFPGRAVARGAILAEKLDPAYSPPLLHFELRQGSGSQWGAANPGTSLDPLQTREIFSVGSGVRPPELEEASITRKHPGQFAFIKAPPDYGESIGPVYFFARWIDREPGPSANDFRLGLRSVRFQADGMTQASEIHPVDEAAVDLYRIPGASGEKGYARYNALHAANPDSLNWHRYWWAWDTAGYISNALGPRNLVLIGEDFDGVSTTNILSFGPSLQDNVWQPLAGRACQLTIIACLGSTNGSGGLVQPDQYRLEAFRIDKSPMPGVWWDGTEPGDLTRVFSNHLECATYTLHLPAGESWTNLVVRVSSLLVPDIRHEVKQGVVHLQGRYSLAPPLVDIPAGSFLMGSPASEALRTEWEGPQTLVTLSRSLKMGRFEVTQAEYQALMSNNPSYFGGDPTRPVESITWSNAMEYCRRLTAVEQQAGFLPPGWAYRLPTEAEWEYACRAETTNAFYFGPALRTGMANFDGTCEYDAILGEIYNLDGIHLWRTTPVGSYTANPWGLFDMHGNTWEWCLDWWTPSLPGGNVTDPQSPASGTERSLRGGCWYSSGKSCRAAYRSPCNPEMVGNDIGFRIVLAHASP